MLGEAGLTPNNADFWISIILKKRQGVDIETCRGGCVWASRGDLWASPSSDISERHLLEFLEPLGERRAGSEPEGGCVADAVMVENGTGRGYSAFRQITSRLPASPF